MNIFSKFLIKLFKIKPCKKCGSWDTKRGYFASGWNNLCEQASGDWGRMCNDCIHVEFDESLEVRKSKDPNWVNTTR